MLSAIFYPAPLVPVGFFFGILLLIMIVPVFAVAALVLALILALALLLALASATVMAPVLLVRAARARQWSRPRLRAAERSAPAQGAQQLAIGAYVRDVR